jgi:preprotein translocase subunit SecG
VSALIIVLHVVICLILIVAVLLQSGKAADLAGAFGGVGSQTAFGPRGTATILSKVTTICAVLFMFTSLGLWILSGKGQRSVVSGEAPAKKEVPAATEPAKQAETAPVQKPEDKKTQASEPEKKETPPEKKIN